MACSLFGNKHYLLTCDRVVAHSAIPRIAQVDNLIEIQKIGLVNSSRPRDRFMQYRIVREGAKVLVGISKTGTRQGQESIDGEYWIFIDSVGIFSRAGVALAESVRSTLLDLGASE